MTVPEGEAMLQLRHAVGLRQRWWQHPVPVICAEQIQESSRIRRTRWEVRQGPQSLPDSDSMNAPMAVSLSLGPLGGVLASHPLALGATLPAQAINQDGSHDRPFLFLCSLPIF